ncbi:HIT domain-containing protein [Nocardiopsis sp. CT-R113]|uniref:HIT domain-containing protein n=1 Tax=Nocardiopsis codii TaxID=3065942 RepID=A0ABU7K218_9ACTN|nr:HIT domain-containing protein [Nocardiopsis sp. CT-R113]MEE2036112.1 HIT domain-containing protein [Nocardiopsis sp. CT-R113]
MTHEICPFCLIVQGKDPSARIVYDDGEVLAFFPLKPATRGHTLLIPQRHVPDIWNLTESEARSLAAASLEVSQALRSAVDLEGLNVIQSNGEAATQTVHHLHVHLVPRWKDDGMTLIWPEEGAEVDEQLDHTLKKVQGKIPPQLAYDVDPEDRRQHLSFIQSVVTRMSQASSSAKTWLLPIVTAAYGYAITRNAETVVLLGLGAVLVFGFLDANYLKQERAFRRLYDKVASGARIPHFSMNPSLAAPDGNRVNYWPDREDILSWAIAPVYGPLLAIGVFLFFLILL